jgi:uncharacterized membrane protein
MLRPTGGGPRRPVAYTPRHGPPFSPPACPGQGRGDRYDRVLFFSDAIFAIAITLLIVHLHVPDVPNLQSGTQLRESIPRMAGLALSFAVIGLFWIAHHGLFRYIKGLDRSLILLNLLFLGCIAFLPYPTSLLSAAGDQVPATVFYAASIAAAGLAEAAVWLYAIRQPALGQYLWLLALVSALVVRRLEPPETDPTTTGNGDPSKPR